MRVRIVLASMISFSVIAADTSSAQNSGDQYRKDEATGLVYQKIKRTIDRPVQETRMVQRQQTTYTPRTVTETRPTARTTYYPAVQTVLEPYIANRWNPFARPSLGYRFRGVTTWQAQTDVVNQTTQRTEYVADTRTFDVPETVNRIVREQREDWEPVASLGRPAPASPQQQALASRLQPLDSGDRMVPLGNTSVASRTIAAPRIAANAIGHRMASDPPRRSAGHSGQPATNLTLPQRRGYGQALPPATAPFGVAAFPVPTIMR